MQNKDLENPSFQPTEGSNKNKNATFVKVAFSVLLSALVSLLIILPIENLISYAESEGEIKTKIDTTYAYSKLSYKYKVKDSLLIVNHNEDSNKIIYKGDTMELSEYIFMCSRIEYSLDSLNIEYRNLASKNKFNEQLINTAIKFGSIEYNDSTKSYIIKKFTTRSNH
jgi:hypothetical protein